MIGTRFTGWIPELKTGATDLCQVEVSVISVSRLRHSAELP